MKRAGKGQASMDMFLRKIRKSVKATEAVAVAPSDSEQPGTSSAVEHVQAPLATGVTKKSTSGRRFQEKWRKEFTWIQYVSEKDVMVCSVCLWALSNNRVRPAVQSVLEGQGKRWIEGFNSWRKGLYAIQKHNESSHHKECVNIKLAEGNAHMMMETLCRRSFKVKEENRRGLKAIFDALLYLARQGQPLRGHTENESNFKQLLNFCSMYDSQIKSWINGPNKFKWLGPEIQNEILAQCSHEILRNMVKDIREARWYSLIADETADISRKEQLSICIRHVDSSFGIHEDFIGFCVVDQTTSLNIFSFAIDQHRYAALQRPVLLWRSKHARSH